MSNLTWNKEGQDVILTESASKLEKGLKISELAYQEIAYDQTQTLAILNNKTPLKSDK